MFKLKEWLLLIEKLKNKDLSVDISVQETDDDKRLITWKVIKWNETYKDGEIIVFWKYSLFLLTYLWNDYYFLDNEDVLATINE